MPIDLYPNIAKVKRNGVYQNLPGFVQQSGDADIEAMIANKETSTTAQFAHDKDSFFILNDVLYQADENISVNDIIAVGTNCHVSVLGDEIASQSAKIEEVDTALSQFIIEETTNINDLTGNYSPYPLTKANKYVAAIVPNGTTVHSLDLLVNANSTAYVKLEKWEYDDTTQAFVKPNTTITADSISQDVSGKYLLHFGEFKTTKKTLLTFDDPTSSGWIIAGPNGSTKRFPASATSITENDLETTTWKMAYSISYSTTSALPTENSEKIAKLEKITTKTVVVAKDGTGNYTSVKEAVDTEPENTIIIVHPGVYTEETIDCRLKRIIVIGTDKNQCIIQNPNGLYANPTFWVGCGYFENLTIKAPYISGTSEEVGVSDLGAYAIHCDTTNYNIDKELEFHHCTLASDFNAAVGAGLRKGFTLILDDCEMFNNQVSGRGDYSDEGSLGALYFHDASGVAGVQTIKVHNCIMRSNLEYTLVPYMAYGDSDVIVNCEFVNNVLLSSEGLTNNIWFRNDPFNELTGNFKLVIGFGNSNSDINN